MMIDQTQWVSALSALPSEELLTVTSELSRDWSISPKSLPQSGLGVLKLNDSAFEEPFYLGEFPLASAWLEIKTADGKMAQGAAQVMNDRIEVAEALAICDAVLSAKLPGWEKIAELLKHGKTRQEATRRERQQILATTQVDFSLLDEASDDEIGDNNAQS
ncbi:MAG: alpha-D-ribose 1-methylphosphonate 5-triphosphate synthase subunit PhnG [Oleiphilaceae bacterium]|jgi:alpha-D-ribose 1-methylphosphonate 5-triphosphate synthase subunit PhnG